MIQNNMNMNNNKEISIDYSNNPFLFDNNEINKNTTTVYRTYVVN